MQTPQWKITLPVIFASIPMFSATTTTITVKATPAAITAAAAITTAAVIATKTHIVRDGPLTVPYSYAIMGKISTTGVFL
jgi:hypothetical protein